MQYKRIDSLNLVRYLGVFKKEMRLFEAVTLITSGTIGAGVLGIPYVVSKVGITVGLLYIFTLGFLMMGLNLLVGEVASKTKTNLQLGGLARKYLGKIGGYIMSTLVYVMSFGILVVYVIGEGEALSALLGGNSFYWSLLFFGLASILVIFGLRVITKVEFVLSMCILVIVLLVAGMSGPHVNIFNLAYTNSIYLFLPYGVILFAFSGASAIPEAHFVLRGKDDLFKKAIVIAGLIAISVYSLFAVMVVGVTGAETTEIATIGLGEKVGPALNLFGNIFAILAMGTSFLMASMTLKDSLRWDYKLSNLVSSFIVLLVPLLVFLLGLRQFTQAIDIVGGVFVSLEMLLLVLIYWRAKHVGDLKKSKYHLHHTLLLVVLLVLALTVGAIYSVVKLF